MPDLHTLAVFAVACLALTATPGPDMMLIATRSIAQGRLAGFATLAGIQFGTYLHALAMAFGLSQLFALVPLAYDAVRWLGAAYLLYLAWTTLKSSPQSAPGAAADGAQQHPTRTLFAQGLLTNVLNPKMVLFVLALFPQFLDPAAGSVVWQALVLATVLNIVGLAVNGAVILAAHRARTWIAGTGAPRRWPQYLLAGVFAGLALRLATSSRT